MSTVNPTDAGVNPPAGYRMTAKAINEQGQSIPYESFLKAGWPFDQLIAHGYVEKIPEPVDVNLNAAAIEAAAAAQHIEDIRSLALAEEELYQARDVFKTAEKSGDAKHIHECRKWVEQLEFDIEELKRRVGEQPRPADSPTVAIGEYVNTSIQPALFRRFVYVHDIHRIVSPTGFIMDQQKFDAHPRFAGRLYQVKADGSKPVTSAWDAFIHSEVVQGVKVDGLLFDPRERPGAIIEREGQRFVNTWQPVSILMMPGDVTPFLDHLDKLFPEDWPTLLDYMKFMVQQKGTKAMWWPFLQGVPGNGKSFISDTMEYCIGYKFTQRPTPKNLDNQFNASLYGCLFLALEDVQVAEDHAKFWAVLKPMVTQSRLEIQPKGVDKVTREVCFNAIINSNYKDGIRKTADDRRIAPMFSRQQLRGDLIRDGLTEAYFKKLWNWAKPELGGKGWAHVAYYLAHEPISRDFDPTQCPITSSTAEAIRVGRSPAEQEIEDAIDSRREGFRGGWVNMQTVEILLRLHAKTRHIARQGRFTVVEALGYIPHPGLPDGRAVMPLPDGTTPVLYVLPDHTTLQLTDPAQIVAAYLKAQQP